MHHTRLWYNKFMIPYIIQYHTADEGSRYENSETWAPLIWTRGSYLNRHEPDRWLSVKGKVYFQSLALLPMVTLTFGMSWISSSMIPSSLMKEWLMNGSDILRAYSSENGFSSWHFIVIVRLLQRSFWIFARKDEKRMHDGRYWRRHSGPTYQAINNNNNNNNNKPRAVNSSSIVDLDLDFV